MRPRPLLNARAWNFLPHGRVFVTSLGHVVYEQPLLTAPLERHGADECHGGSRSARRAKGRSSSGLFLLSSFQAFESSSARVAVCGLHSRAEEKLSVQHSLLQLENFRTVCKGWQREFITTRSPSNVQMFIQKKGLSFH